MKLTGSTNVCYVNDRNICTVKVNIKETSMGNNGFLQTFICWMGYNQRIQDLLHDDSI